MSKQSTARWISITGLIAVFGYLAVVVLYLGGGAPEPRITSTSTALEVVGTLSVVVPDGSGGTTEVDLPDADVFLRDPLTGSDVATAVTLLDGTFRLPAPSAGTFSVCWSVQGVSGCGPDVTVVYDSVHLPVRITPQTPVLHGTVLTLDGRACWVNDSFFDLDVATFVDASVVGGSPVRTGIRANTVGDYALLGLPSGDYLVQARCENAHAQTLATLANFSVAADLTLPNRAPRIWAIAAFDSGVGVTRVAPSTVVEVVATVRDADLDPIEMVWRTLDGYGTIPGTAATKQTWTLPSQPGQYTLYAMARDGRGGYAYERFDLQVDISDISFSGRVIDETTQGPVAGADVEVNGTSVTTNAQGWFNLTVPAVASDRYVLNVRHPQYAVLSRIHDRSAAGNTYPLIRAQTLVVDPTQPINLVDTQSGGPCGSPGGVYTPAITPLADLRSSKSTTETGNQETNTEPCRHRGARLLLPAFSLVDALGVQAVGPVTASTATLNPERRALPGDYQAFDSGGTRSELLSFGAVYAEFRDASGNLLNLKPGTTAEVRIPVSDLQLPVAAPQIALWSYDEGTGFWVEEGIASLTNTADGWMYVGQTQHFSTINMDVAGSDPAFATCVRLQLDASLSGWTDLVLRAYVSYNGDSVQVKETALDGSDYHAIYRIPYGSGFPPNTLRLELRGTYGGLQVVLLDDIINTDARPKMTGTNLWPPYPYTECGDPITLAAEPVNLPYYGDIDATGRPAFLTGPYGTFLPEDGETVATDYYAAIDPSSLKTTLGDWWDENGFDPTDGSALGAVRAAYLNFNDLGFGRDMHCLENSGDLACWVTNYGLPNQNLGNADAAESQDATQRGATVTMEYDASAAATERVQFFVFGGGVASAPRIKFADLDGLGPKPVPHLCTVCHGGRFNDTTKKADYARFREFDLPSFKYSSGRSWDFGDSSLLSAELTAYASLNEMVRDIAPSPSPIRSLIDEWYPGGFGPGTPPVLPDPPSGWSTEVTGYHDVYAKSCRTCHLARDGSGPTFDTHTSFQFTPYVVCDSPKRMPNAFVTYKNFWNDPLRVAKYVDITTATACE